uniref:Psoralen synthase n=1 Tax=Ammi majus TaxID=48026 RepID=C71AJ_AMMMJ|nr:RecName: Full=Psoralen synthase; AltName: Full=Cytochrome P450 CYP71AJ1 [Ammi majus]AAT06911.1 psoralen synthase [Ammi majus]
MKMLEQNPQYLYFFSLFLVTIFLYKWLTLKKTPLKNLPPSPPQYPIIGNLHQIGPDPQASLRDLAQKYGPLMFLKFGTVPVLVVSSADAAREALKTHDLVFADRPYSSVANKIFYNGKDMVFARYTEYWRQVKSICVTQLLSNKRVNSFHYVREEEVDLLVQNLENSHSKVANLTELLIEVTGNVVCRVSVGSGDKVDSYKILILEIMDMLGYSRSIEDFFPLLGWVDWLTGLRGKVAEAAKGVDTFLEGVLKEHLSTTGSKYNDFVSILLEIQEADAGSSMDNECIKSLIWDMLGAGTETISTALEWTLAALIKNPDAMFKLQNEVREIGKGKSKISEADLVKMNYLQAVMKESMRLYFTAPLLVPREARQDIKFMGYDISSGTQVLINAWAIARDPLLWDKPEEFRPERFLNSPIDYKGFHYEFLPFGAGRRGCPGIQFAMCINELVVANLVHKFNFELPDGKRLEDLDMTAASGITLRKKSPLLVVARPHV